MAKKTRTFEERLLDMSGADKLKAAKQLLKHDGIKCVYRSGVNTISGEARTGAGRFSLVLHPGEEPECSCSCGDSTTPLCEHAVALIMYYARFSTPWVPEVEELSTYAGLKYEPLSKLGSKDKHTCKSYLTIEANSAFPHVPSKWENANFSVKLHTKDRDYLGNVSNLRQLYFEKTLTVTVKLSDFSLQDQQIIRFLAINGEPEGANILLNSEEAADFFHSLVGFERFTRNGKLLYIRGETAEAVMLRHAAEDGAVTYSPGVRINGKLLPVANAKVVTGRSGCWVGCAGEYFFVPAVVDVGWLRNFFRSGKEEVQTAQAAEWENVFPLPVVDATDTDVPESAGRVMMSGEFDSIGNFRLEIDYAYGENIFATNSGTLACSGDMLTRREQEKERDCEQDLSMFGFEKRGRLWILEDINAAGVFLEKLLPRWRATRPEVFCSGVFCAGEIPEAEFHVKECREGEGSSYILNFEFVGGGRNLDLREAIHQAHEDAEYMHVPKGIVKLTPAMRRFLIGIDTMWQNVEEQAGTFRLPSYAVNFYSHLAQDLPGAMPDEFRYHPLLSRGRALGNMRPPHERKFKFTGDLRAYQREGVSYLSEMTGAGFNVILADEMGLGKTVQLLAMLADDKDPNGYPALLICPASLLTNWVRECNRFVPEMRVVAAEGHNRSKIWDSREQYDLIVLSYAAARLDIDRLKKLKFEYLILDEAQHIKNPGTANAQICKAISCKHKIVLTGTPLENSPEDLWSIFDFLHPGMLGSYAKFKKHYAHVGEDPALGAELASRVAPFIKRRTKKMVALELPPKEEQLIFCELSDAQRELYDKVLEEGRRELQLSRNSGGNMELFTTLLRLRQICCHPRLLPEEFGAAKMLSAKIDLLLELVLEHIDSGHKLLIFSQFTSLLAIIGKDLTELGIAYEYLDGSTRNRQDRVDRFNKTPELQVFLLSLKAGGTGLNLTSADTVIICDPWWNPAAELQAADRTHRIGQTRQVSTIKLLVKDSIEEKILELQGRKQEIFNQVIDSSQMYSEKLSMEELRYLLD